MGCSFSSPVPKTELEAIIQMKTYLKVNTSHVFEQKQIEQRFYLHATF